MTRALAHRGPDAEGFFERHDQGVDLGHRRLTILDLSDRANQPMVSPDGRFAVVYNGEIYNFVELREELKRDGLAFRTTSDTEVIHHAYAKWGTDCFKRFRGMFSIGLYDTMERELILARDPLGIKPLYFVHEDDCLAFASEARVLWRHAAICRDASPDMDRMRILLAHGYLPDRDAAPVKGIRKLAPGSFLRFREGRLEQAAYWTLEKQSGWEGLSFDEGCERFQSLFRETVKIMLRSDVPLSFLLSGGLDSSLVLATAREFVKDDVQAFTAVFGHPLDETRHAADVARHLGVSHELLEVNIGEALDELTGLIDCYDDLSTTDPGIFMVALISRLIAGKDRKVTFVGEGADEIFGGYSWFGLSQLPFRLLSPAWRARGYYYATSRLASRSYWHHAERIQRAFEASGDTDLLRQVSFCEITLQLPNNLLQKVDRGTMSSSIEARVPYMDHEVVSAAYSMPAAWKRSGAWFRFGSVQEKRLLRTLAARCLPESISRRKKRGFPLPVATTLLRHRDAVRDILLAQDSFARELMDARTLEKLLNFSETMYSPLHKQREVLAWRLLIASLWHRHCFRGPQ